MQELKKQAAKQAASLVETGMVVGLGTGSTADFFIRELAQRIVNERLQIKAIATSKKSEVLARELGIEILDSFPQSKIDLTVDGADEIDPQINLIKGLGGALLMEKIVARHSRKQVIISDESKLVDKLGEKVVLPVEVVQFGYQATWRQLEQLGAKVVLRYQGPKGNKGTDPFVSDMGNFILDCNFGPMSDSFNLSKAIKNITGVIDHGLFINMADMAIVATRNGIKTLSR